MATAMNANAIATIGNAWIELARAEAEEDNNNDEDDSNNALITTSTTPKDIWSILHQRKLSPKIPFEIHRHCYERVYAGETVKPCWLPSEQTNKSEQRKKKQTTTTTTTTTNIEKFMQVKGFENYQQLYDYSVNERDSFWMESAQNVNIQWETKPVAAFDYCGGGAAADAITYFPGGRLNIADSCLLGCGRKDNTRPAIVYANDSDPANLQHVTLGELEALANQIADALTNKLHAVVGDAIAICLPMVPEALAVYLGIVKAGCVVVSIADSFSAREIATRCRIAGATACITQDVIYRGTKAIPLLERVLQASAMVQGDDSDAAVAQQQQYSNNDDNNDGKESKSEEEASDYCCQHTMKMVVLPAALHTGSYNNNSSDKSKTDNDDDDDDDDFLLHETARALLRPGLDWTWANFLHGAATCFDSVIRDSTDACNILFSSGTTGDPKAIVWMHATPIKCAVDGHYHQDLQDGDRIAWPTNIGWMMGPWVLYQLINGATICLFTNGLPHSPDFCKFVEVSGVTMLGVIPSLVKAWQARGSCDNADWSKIRRFSSTGEASDPVNYHWLMSRVPGYAPVIEYCGGTEIGGSFLSSTLLQPNVPSMFSTPVLGSALRLLDSESNKVLPQSEYKTGVPNERASGELVLLPPSIGLSTRLLNRDHYECYYAGMPVCSDSGEVLRRHGDCMEVIRCSNGIPYFHALGRCDDTMNLGGIKVSSVEIERVCNMVEAVKETAAIAVSFGGPCELVIYAVTKEGEPVDTADLKIAMQQSIKEGLNPLFAISAVVVTTSLPRTASNKIMRRFLRDDYVKSLSSEK